MVDFACVESDFMIHNRQLLPLIDHVCQQQQSNRWLRANSRHVRASETLQAQWEALANRAHALGCQSQTTVRLELHLSGFFSMLGSVVKPWTAALRIHRALMTPSAPGLISPSLCKHEDLSCFFRPLGPRRCDPAPTWLPQVRLNLPQLHRESLTSGLMLPEKYRSFGLFWWAAQLYGRLMEPNADFKAQLQSNLVSSGMQQALDAGEVVAGIHVRHGDSCMPSEMSRTARRCEPLSKYMEAVQEYLHRIGCRTLFIATDSEAVLEDARALHGMRILFLENVSRSGLSEPVPNRIVDEVIKERARTQRGVEKTHRAAFLASLDSHILARTHVLVGKFTSGLFRVAYALAAARRNALVPFVSLDAPWCSDYGIPAGYNDNFPLRPKTLPERHMRANRVHAHINGMSNTFLC